MVAGQRPRPLTLAERIKLKPPRAEPQVNNVKVQAPLQYPGDLSPFILKQAGDNELVELRQTEEPVGPAGETIRLTEGPIADVPSLRMPGADEEMPESVKSLYDEFYFDWDAVDAGTNGTSTTNGTKMRWFDWTWTDKTPEPGALQPMANPSVEKENEPSMPDESTLRQIWRGLIQRILTSPSVLPVEEPDEEEEAGLDRLDFDFSMASPSVEDENDLADPIEPSCEKQPGQDGNDAQDGPSTTRSNDPEKAQEEQPPPSVMETYRLRNASAADVAAALQSQEEIGNVVVTSEPITNKIILVGCRDGVDVVKGIIKNLDVTAPQILVKVLVAEVDVDDAQNIAGGTRSMPIEKVDEFVNDLKKQGRIQIIAQPVLVTLDKEWASLTVGQRVPLNGPDTGFAGLYLQISTEIKSDGNVIMRVIPEVSSVVPEPVSLGNGSTGLAVNVQHFEGTVTATDGKSTVMRGMILERTGVEENKIPWLGDLPVIGSMFRDRTNSVNHTELMVILTPHIVRGEPENPEVQPEYRGTGGSPVPEAGEPPAPRAVPPMKTTEKKPTGENEDDEEQEPFSWLKGSIESAGAAICDLIDYASSWVPDGVTATSDNRTPIMPPLEPGTRHTCEEPPNVELINRAMRPSRGIPGIYEEVRDDMDYCLEKLVDHVDSPRYYPMIGMAQLHHCNWKATVFYTETIKVGFPIQYCTVSRRTEVIYIDTDHLHPFVETAAPRGEVLRTPRVSDEPENQDALTPSQVEWNAANRATRQKVADLTRKALNMIEEGDMAEAQRLYTEAGKLLPLTVKELVALTLPPGSLPPQTVKSGLSDDDMVVFTGDAIAAPSDHLSSPRQFAKGKSETDYLAIDKTAKGKTETEYRALDIELMPIFFSAASKLVGQVFSRNDAGDGPTTPALEKAPGRNINEWVPNETTKVSQHPYTVEPPDILVINADTLKPLKARQQIQGEHLVRPDGTIGLGIYGSVHVDGLTLDLAKAVIEKQLGKFLVDPRISVDVAAFNSKVYYVICDVAGSGQKVFRLPITGKETVLDAIASVYGLTPVPSTHRMWVARPALKFSESEFTMKVDWEGITKYGRGATNYQLTAGDRVYVMADDGKANDDSRPGQRGSWESQLGATNLGDGRHDNVGVPPLKEEETTPTEPDAPADNPAKMSVEEERLQGFWHDYYDALSRYYKSLDRIDWVAYYKNHGTIINNDGGRVMYAPVFVNPSVTVLGPQGSTYAPFGPTTVSSPGVTAMPPWTAPYPPCYPPQQAWNGYGGYYNPSTPLPGSCPPAGTSSDAFPPNPSIQAPPGCGIPLQGDTWLANPADINAASWMLKAPVDPKVPGSYSPNTSGTRYPPGTSSFASSRTVQEDAAEQFLKQQHEKLVDAYRRYEAAVSARKAYSRIVEGYCDDIRAGNSVSPAELEIASAQLAATLRRQNEAIARYDQIVAGFGSLSGAGLQVPMAGTLPSLQPMASPSEEPMLPPPSFCPADETRRTDIYPWGKDATSDEPNPSGFFDPRSEQEPAPTIDAPQLPAPEPEPPAAVMSSDYHQQSCPYLNGHYCRPYQYETMPTAVPEQLPMETQPSESLLPPPLSGVTPQPVGPDSNPLIRPARYELPNETETPPQSNMPWSDRARLFFLRMIGVDPRLETDLRADGAY
jgi:protein involved in polysaccharide export with SLBB domain